MTTIHPVTREVLDYVLWETRYELKLATGRLNRAVGYVPAPCKTEPQEDGIRRMHSIVLLRAEVQRLNQVTADLARLLAPQLPPGIAALVAEDQRAELHLDVTDSVWAELARRARYDCKAVTA